MIFKNRIHFEGKQIIDPCQNDGKLKVPKYQNEINSVILNNKHLPYFKPENFMISPSFPDCRPYEVDSKNNVSTLQKSCLWQSEFGRDQECFSLFQNVNHVLKLDSKWCECEYAGIDSKNNKVDWPNLKGNTPQESFINPYEKLKVTLLYGEMSRIFLNSLNIPFEPKYLVPLLAESIVKQEALLMEISFENENAEDFSQIRDTEYHNRKDVVIKNIFRTFRKFYALKFRHFYDFTKKKMSRIHPSELEIIEYVKDYVSRTFGEDKNVTVISLIVALLDPKGKYTQQRGIFSLMKEHVCKILFKFNKRHLFEIFQLPQFITLMKYFLNEVDVDTLIPRFRRDLDTFRIYARQIDTIRRLCMSERLASSKHIYKFF